MVTSRTTRHVLAALSIGLLAGCATVSTGQYRAYTSGVIGCPAGEVTISGEKNTVTASDFPVTWRATCRGHQFICSHGGGRGDSAQCAEELKPVPPAASPTSSRP
jgi:hypothetical protein